MHIFYIYCIVQIIHLPSSHFRYIKAENKCVHTCLVCVSTRKLTLMPLRDANASWPGLRAMMSPSTSRLTGRLTSWESR